jgi:hypothetical protein
MEQTEATENKFAGTGMTHQQVKSILHKNKTIKIEPYQGCDPNKVIKDADFTEDKLVRNMKTTDEHLARRFLELQASAISRNKEFNLSLKEVRKIMDTTKCFYTGVELTRKMNVSNMLTFDRVDNDLGYVSGNVVACCLHINQAKSKLSFSDLSLITNVLLKKGYLKIGAKK